MRDQNLVRLTGTIFWSKLDDRQTYTVLRLGLKLGDSTSVFCTVNNPDTKVYDLIKSGNKVLITNGWLDTWDKQDGTSEVQIKANGNNIAFFPKEKVIADINHVSIVGKVLSYSEDSAQIEMIGDRNPKTDKPSVRKAKIKIGDSFKEIAGTKIVLDGRITAPEVDGKSKLVIEADYDKISVI